MVWEQLIAWLFTTSSVLGGCVCSIFFLVLLTRLFAVRTVSAGLICLGKAVAVSAAYFACSFLGICIGFLISDEWRAFLQQYLGMFGMAAAACALFRDNKLQTRIVYAALFTTTWILAAAFNFLVAEWFAILPPVDDFNLLFALPRLLVSCALVVLLKVFNIDRYEGKSNYSVMLFGALCGVVCLLQSFTFFSVEDLDTVNYFSLWIWIMELAAYMFYYLFLRENNRYIFYEVENRRLAGELHYYKYMQNYFDEMRMLKHDMKNQFSYLRLLYAQGKDEDARDYFAELDRSARQTLDFVSTGNKPIDIVLNLTIARARQEGIRLEYACNVPSDMRFQNSDLFSMLINLCDNAVEAAMLAPEQDRLIAIELYSNSSYLIVSVSNSVHPEADVKQMLAMERSSKRDAEGHGYGHRIVQSVVQKYDGDILYAVEEGRFVAKAMLALHDVQSLPGGNK